MEKEKLKKISGWSGVFVPVIFVSLVAVASILTPGFNQISHDISELGIIGTYPLIQDINFLIIGFLSIIFAVGFGEAISKAVGEKQKTLTNIITLAGIGIFASGIALIFVKVIPEQLAIGLHVSIIFVAFILMIVTQILSGRILKKTKTSWQTYGKYSLVSGFTSLALFAIMLITQIGPYEGLTERIFVGVILIWTFVSGLKLISS